MQKIISPVFFLNMFLLLCLFAAPAAWAQNDAPGPKQAIMVDYETGAILLSINPDQRMPTSSMSKTMTMYLVFEALKDGRLQLDSKLPVSEKAWRMQGSKMFVKVGDHVAVEDLIRGVIIQSGNDATIVLAEGLAGSEEAFADAMNVKARELGMVNSHFTNASGWPDPNHYSTARDLAILGRRLIQDFPDLYHYYAETEFTYNNIKQGNRNPLLYRGVGGDGIKTGHTEDAGYGLMGSGERDGRRVVFVVNGLPSMNARAQESARVLDQGLRNFINVTLFKPGQSVEQAPVVMGEFDRVPLVVDKNLVATIPVTLRNDLKVEVRYNSPLIAPIKRGDAVGTISVTIPRGEVMEFPLLAGADVPKLGLFGTAFTKARLMIMGGRGEDKAEQ